MNECTRGNFESKHWIMQVVRRSSAAEKFLVIVKYRQGHKCNNSWIVVSIVAWEGIPAYLADQAYDGISYNLVSVLATIMDESSGKELV